MESKIKRKVVLKDEALQHLKRNNPEVFEIKEYIVKVKQDKSFIKLMFIDKSYYDYIIKNLWFAYLWYFMVLLNWLNYDNIINFTDLKFKWVSDSMIKVCKRKFIQIWVIKKYWNSFYVNPNIAMKWESINPNIIELFK